MHWTHRSRTPRFRPRSSKERLMRQHTGAATVVAMVAVVAGLQPLACAYADVVTDWNVIALNATAVPANSILQSRVLAIVHGAIYDAVRAIDRKGAAYAVELNA